MNTKYKVYRYDAAGLIARLSNSMVWNEFGSIRVDLGDVDDSGHVNVYVDGLLAATLRPVKDGE